MNEDASTVAVDPSSRQTMRATNKPEQNGAKKKGLIVGGIITCVAVLIGVIVAVVLARPASNADAFEKAQEKFFSLDGSRNVKFDGYAKVTISDSSSPISDINFNLDGQFAGTPSIGNAKMSAEFKLNGGQAISPEIELTTTATGDYYIKPSGLAQSFSKLVGYSYDLLPKDNPVVSLIDKIENQWLLISVDDVKEMMGSISDEDTEGATTCISEYMSSLSQNKYGQMEIIKKYPFLVASQDNITIPQKANPIYRITLDRDNLEKALGEFEKSEWTKGLMSCANVESDSVSSIELDEALSSIPVELYLEIDDNYDVTRVYMSFDLDDKASIKMVADINISYPDTVNIAEPAEYDNFSDVFTDFMQTMSVMQES